MYLEFNWQNKRGGGGGVEKVEVVILVLCWKQLKTMPTCYFQVAASASIMWLVLLSPFVAKSIS